MEKINKKVFIINGRSGVGKDTLIEGLAQEYKVHNVSSIDKVKEISLFAGWDGVKDERGRKLLVDIKNALVEYDDLPTKYMVEEYQKFLQSDNEFMFVHIREAWEIDKLKKEIPCKTILVRRKDADTTTCVRNNSVEDYNYDIVYDNDLPLEESKVAFVKLMTE